jgi:pimeloyl-ACP methyl ester carboxylesterase
MPDKGTRIGPSRYAVRPVVGLLPSDSCRTPGLPTCPTVVLSAGRPEKRRERQNALAREHQRRYTESLPSGRYESVDSGHLIMAEQPQLVANRILQLVPSYG